LLVHRHYHPLLGNYHTSNWLETSFITICSLAGDLDITDVAGIKSPFG
jgi:hypothetical protein